MINLSAGAVFTLEKFIVIWVGAALPLLFFSNSVHGWRGGKPAIVLKVWKQFESC